MTDEDRDATVQRFSDMFDAVGEEGADALVAELGSPTKSAISLSRGYEPGDIEAFLNDKLPAPEAPQPPEPEPEPAAPEAASDEPWDELPSFELPPLPLVDEGASAAPGGEDGPDGGEDEVPAVDPAEEGLPRPVRTPRRTPAEEAAAAEPWREARIERSIPLGLGVPLFVLVFVALGVPIAAVFLALMVVLLAPGLALVFAAYLAAVGGLWCLSFIPDAVMMFGLAFLILAVAVLVLWLGVRLDVRLGRVYLKGVDWVAGELLGRRVTDDEDA